MFNERKRKRTSKKIISMGFWSLMIKKDDVVISIAECLRRLRGSLSFSSYKVEREMKSRAVCGLNKELYILLNAPSLSTQDISVLKGKTTMFVNRGFKHPLYKELQPAFHVFIDPKMLDGTWPVSWLDEIWSMSPDTIIILPLSWHRNQIFKDYKDNPKIFWTPYNLPFYNLGVSGACFAFAIGQRFKKIYFSGFDANGIGYELVKASNSHFYGNDKELENKPTSQFVIDLLMHSRHLHDLNRFAEWSKKRGIKIINITNGGLLDMFPRANVLPIKAE